MNNRQLINQWKIAGDDVKREKIRNELIFKNMNKITEEDEDRRQDQMVSLIETLDSFLTGGKNYYKFNIQLKETKVAKPEILQEEDESYEYESIYDIELVKLIIPMVLKNIEIYIIKNYYFSDKSYRLIGDELGLTRERVRQLLIKSIAKLRIRYNQLLEFWWRKQEFRKEVFKILKYYPRIKYIIFTDSINSGLIHNLETEVMAGLDPRNVMIMAETIEKPEEDWFKYFTIHQIPSIKNIFDFRDGFYDTGCYYDRSLVGRVEVYKSCLLKYRMKQAIKKRRDEYGYYNRSSVISDVLKKWCAI